jgi:hypothetical protein
MFRRLLTCVIALSVLAAMTGYGTRAATPVFPRLPASDGCALHAGRADCGRNGLVKVAATRTGVSTAIVRRNASVVLRVTIDAVQQSVQKVGLSVRSVAAGFRQRVQRRFAVSICCADRIQANAIADDLARRFPGARIERRVRVQRESDAEERRADDGANLGDIVDFLVFDDGQSFLVFESCIELDDQQMPQAAAEARHAAVDGAPVPIESGRTTTIEACFDFETGAVSYEVVSSPSPSP